MKEEKTLLTSPPRKTQKRYGSSKLLLETKELTPLIKKTSRNLKYKIGNNCSFMLKPNSECISNFVIHSLSKEEEDKRTIEKNPNANPPSHLRALPKIAKITPIIDNYEQISSSPLPKHHPYYHKHNHSSSKTIFENKSNHLHLPKISTKEFIIDQLIQLVHPNIKWDINYQRIKDCMKKSVKYTPEFEILFEEEMKRINLEHSTDFIKTSLTKTKAVQPNKNHCSTFRSNNSKMASNKKPTNNPEQTYSQLIFNEKESEKKLLFNKLQYIQASYEKQKYNHRGNTIIEKPIPLQDLQKKNKECVIVNQKEGKKVIKNKVLGVSNQIRDLRKNILEVLDKNLSEFKNELNREYNIKSEVNINCNDSENK